MKDEKETEEKKLKNELTQRETELMKEGAFIRDMAFNRNEMDGEIAECYSSYASSRFHKASSTAEL